jgi:hypothetical protein
MRSADDSDHAAGCRAMRIIPSRSAPASWLLMTHDRVYTDESIDAQQFLG